MDQGNTDTAISTLSTIMSDQPCFIDAKSRIAEIYLLYKKDLNAYAKCYKELVELAPDFKSWGLLGDAYMNINDPEKAVDAYEQSTRYGTDDSISVKIGKAIVKTLDFPRAIRFYEQIVSTQKVNPILLYDLADLYRRLKMYSDVEQTVERALDHKQVDEIAVLLDDVRFYSLLAKSTFEFGDYEKSIAIYMKSRELMVRYFVINKDEFSEETLDQWKIKSIEKKPQNYANLLPKFMQNKTILNKQCHITMNRFPFHH